MWASLKESIVRDLGEFATVVTTDAQSAVSIFQGGIVYGGDESTSLYNVAPDIDSKLILELQCAPETYAENLSTDEQNKVHQSTGDLAELTTQVVRQELLAKSTHVAEMYRRFVVGAGPNDPEASVSEDLFFHRYFVRLSALRLQWQSQREKDDNAFDADGKHHELTSEHHQASPQHRQHQEQVMQFQDPMFSGGWGMEKASSPVNRTTTYTTASEAQQSGSVQRQTETSATDINEYVERIKELERVIELLSSQVQMLSNENENLSQKYSKVVQDLIDEKAAHDLLNNIKENETPSPSIRADSAQSAFISDASSPPQIVRPTTNANKLASTVFQKSPSVSASIPSQSAQQQNLQHQNDSFSPPGKAQFFTKSSPIAHQLQQTQQAATQSPPSQTLTQLREGRTYVDQSTSQHQHDAIVSTIALPTSHTTMLPSGLLEDASVEPGEPSKCESTGHEVDEEEKDKTTQSALRTVPTVKNTLQRRFGAAGTGATVAGARPIAPLPNTFNDEELDEEWATIA